MNYQAFSSDFFYIVSDLSAGVFLIILILSIALQSERRRGPGHLLAASVLVLEGLVMRLLAYSINSLPYGFDGMPKLFFVASVPAKVFWILSFICMAIAITESATHVIYVNEEYNKSGFKDRLIATLIIVVAGSVLFAYVESGSAFSIAILVQFAYLMMHLSRNKFKHALKQYSRASALAIVTFIIAALYEPARVTGQGLFLMLLMLNEQYHSHIERELAEKEVELARGKVQLLAEQISPHYIYNSLQSIRDLCVTDPGKARDALDAFSEYLRGNLESLTIETLSPFFSACTAVEEAHSKESRSSEI